jgi:hypothetical protein
MPKKIFNLNISKIREQDENEIEKKMKDIKLQELNTFEKRIMVLKEEKTSNILVRQNTVKEGENDNIILIDVTEKQSCLNNSSINNTDSTIDNSNRKNDKIIIDNSFDLSCFDIKAIINESNFNDARKYYYLNYKLYDLPLNQNINKYENTQPCKYIINKDYFTFAYPNKISTFSLAISGFLKTDKINEDNASINKEIKNNKYYQLFGIFFCEKDISLKDGQHKKCAPNDFMCKECMKKNRNIYNLKNNYMINIIGRIAKKNKGSYHCFGHFLVGDNIEDCLTKFTCEGCKLLNLYSEYFN